jgi:hypothetical protein
MSYDCYFYLSDVTAESFTVYQQVSVGGDVTNIKYSWYAIGVGEEDTALRDSLASTLENKGVNVTEEDDIASLISKVDLLDYNNQLYLFDAGYEFVNATGGWVIGSGSDNAGTQITTTATKGTALYICSKRTATGIALSQTKYIKTVNKINVTKFNTLKVDIDSTTYKGHSSICLYSSEPPYPGNFNTLMPEASFTIGGDNKTYSGEVNLDISNLNGEYYICIMHRAYSTDTFTYDNNYIKVHNVILMNN